MLLAACIVEPKGSIENPTVPVRLMNLSSEGVTIYKGTRVGQASALRESEFVIAGIRENGPVPHGDISVAKQQLLWQATETAAEDLTLAQREKLYAVLLEYADVFAEDSGDLGRTELLQHNIETGDAPLVRQPSCRIPAAQQEEVKQLLKEMETKGIIQPSKSPWASPVVLVRKKDGSMRFCVDYRKLNAVTHKDAYILPRIDDTLQALSGSRWFSTIDLLSGYWQVGVAEKDKEKTAFITQEGLFGFNAMPFGLCNAPATFQRLISLVLSGILWTECLVYLDDIIIFGHSFKEHLTHLASVFRRLREVNLKVKSSKCAFLQKQVLYLGHVISSEGIATDSSKTQRITEWPTPCSVQEVKQFVGLASYYR